MHRHTRNMFSRFKPLQQHDHSFFNFDKLALVGIGSLLVTTALYIDDYHRWISPAEKWAQNAIHKLFLFIFLIT